MNVLMLILILVASTLLAVVTRRLTKSSFSLSDIIGFAVVVTPVFLAGLHTVAPGADDLRQGLRLTLIFLGGYLVCIYSETVLARRLAKALESEIDRSDESSS